MKMLSLFSGLGGFELAGSQFGIEPVAASEIDPFCVRVTQERFPNMKHLGSVTEINGADIEPVDIVCFGSPCQDLSVAGAQKGIHEGDRSNLFFEAIRIIKEMRENDERVNGRTGIDVRPRWIVFENVPGAFNSNHGEDFRAILEAFCNIRDETAYVPRPAGRKKWSFAGCIVGNGYSIAWKTLNAALWGVPQRRQRVYATVDLGSERAAEVQFIGESIPWSAPPRGEKKKGTPANAEGSIVGND